MAKMSVKFVFALVLLVLVHANARNVPTITSEAPTSNEQPTKLHHEETTNVVNVPHAAAPATGKAVKDKKCGLLFAGMGGAAGVGGVMPLGGIGGIGGMGGIGGVSGIGGLGGLGGVGGAAGGAGGVGGVGIIP